MKKICYLILILVVSTFLFSGCSKLNNVVRIHIRANSNCAQDQDVKLVVRDRVIDYITPIIAGCNNSNEVKYSLNNNIKQIESTANNVLKESGFDYVSRAEIRNEYFPSRNYGGEVYPADYYDALIIELGTGEGDNWWCVAYPPLCFVGDDVDGLNIQYRSKLLDMISKFFGD